MFVGAAPRHSIFNQARSAEYYKRITGAAQIISYVPSMATTRRQLEDGWFRQPTMPRSSGSAGIRRYGSLWQVEELKNWVITDVLNWIFTVWHFREVDVNWGELHWEKKLPTRNGISCRNLSAFICENVWWKYLSGVSEVKRGLYKNRIFGDVRHLKCGYGGVWWKYRGLSTKQMKSIANGGHRKRNDGNS